MTVRIANAAGFWGDDISAAKRLVEAADVDFLTLEYLAELTMSILAHQRAKDPQAGFAHDVLKIVADLLPTIQRTRLRIVTNAGGINPAACAAAVSKQLVEAGLEYELIAVISGDDLLPQLDDLSQRGWDFRHFDTGQPFRELNVHPACANAYLGAKLIADAVAAEARMVITGRVADASLTVGPAMQHFGWSWNDWQRLAAATIAGHLIECGAQVTGGYSDCLVPLELVDVGYPIAELTDNGDCVITKPQGSGGVVNRRTVVEQLVYEIGDPSRYMTPDVVANFTTVRVNEVGPDRVLVQGATGEPATDTYKVSLAYPNGYMASSTLVVRGTHVESKARQTGELVFERLRRRGVVFARQLIECLGSGDGVPGSNLPGESETRGTASSGETVLRLTVHDPRRDAVEMFSREIAPLITSGPNGLAGYAVGRPTVRPVLAYFPTLIPKDLVRPRLDVRPAREWLASLP